MKKHKKRISLFLATAFMVLLLPFGAIQVSADEPKVTLNKATMDLTVGDDDTLVATVEVDGKTADDVVWSSDDEDVATVENGKVTAIKAGSATITATVLPDEGETVVATCTVTVTDATVSVTGVTLDKSTLSLVEGADETLTATVAPEGATDSSVAWSSSNESVATVGADGKVTAVAAGTATITVKTTDGDKTATCTVTVTAATVSVTGVTLNKNELSLRASADETLIATVAPEGATDSSVTWSSSDNNIATVGIDGKVTAVAVGTATITVTTTDGSKTATCEVTVTCNHNLTRVEAKSATCTEDGNIEYYKCSVCNKKFSDNAGTEEITGSVVIKKTAHDIVAVAKVEPTCTEDGVEAHYKCNVCNKLFEDSLGSVEISDANTLTIEKLGHTLTKVDAKSATCTEEGNIEYYECSVCNKRFSDNTGTTEITGSVVTSKIAHTLTKVEVKSATCTEDGNIEYYKCNVCDKLFSDATGTTQLQESDLVIPAGHKYEAVWSTDGTHHWHECSVCGDVKDKAEHSWKTEWSTDGTHHWHECSVCGAIKDKATHTPGDKATETTPQTCTICGKVLAPVLAVEPEIVKDESQPDVWTPKSKTGLTFKSTASLADFISVSINGKVIDEKNYTLTEGSTIVTLKPEFLATLPDGKYTIEINSTTGVASTTFTVEDSPVAKDGTPRTGDNNNIIGMVALLALSGASSVGVAVYKKKKDE